MAKKVDKNEFLELANEKFKGQFEYELSNYKALSKGKIKVYCKKIDHFNEPHGWFDITPELHLRGDGGCKNCKYSNGKYLCRDKRDFVYWANLFHEDAYDYSEFIYVDGKGKGLIKCRMEGHPPFLMHPNNHLSRKAGCRKCGKTRAGHSQSKTKQGENSITKRILDEGPKTHSNKFDYSMIDPDTHIRTKDRIKLVCPIHGEFEVQASVHLAGHDCRKCKDEEQGLKRQKSQADFIESCKTKYGFSDDYYSLAEYKGGIYPITLKCPLHGPFVCSSAKGHLQGGYGCKICSGNEKKDRDDIIRLSKEKHGDTYDYSLVETTIANSKDKITIICRSHGIFKQAAVGHYNLGYGCPKCGALKSGLDNIKAFLKDEQRAQSYCELYLVGVGDYIKIGIAENTYERDRRNYNEYFIILPSKRANCWVAEQYLLIQTAWMEPNSLPSKYLNWPGRSELRIREMEVEELTCRMEEVLDEAEEIGWLEFAKKYELPDHGYGWDPESGL